VWPILVQGFGMGMIFVPLSVVAYATLPKALVPEAAGLYSLLRTIGSSVGISIVVTLLTRQTQVAWNQLGEHIDLFNPALYRFLNALHLSLADPRAVRLLGAELARQAQMVAFIDVFMFVTLSFVVMLPLVLVLKYRKVTASDEKTLDSLAS
jgi:DHA2 family multidrug resistance protein